jgi:hypothetical protein
MKRELPSIIQTYILPHDPSALNKNSTTLTKHLINCCAYLEASKKTEFAL